MNLKTLQKLAHKIAVDHKFWECPFCNGNFYTCPICDDTHKYRNNGELVALMISELSEALEAMRLNKWKGKDSVGEELADCVIRIMDFCEARKINLEKEIKQKMKYNRSRPKKHNKEF